MNPTVRNTAKPEAGAGNGEPFPLVTRLHCGLRPPGCRVRTGYGGRFTERGSPRLRVCVYYLFSFLVADRGRCFPEFALFLPDANVFHFVCAYVCVCVCARMCACACVCVCKSRSQSLIYVNLTSTYDPLRSPTG